MKGVYQFSYKTGKYIGKHIDIESAARVTKTTSGAISACCNGKAKHAGGFIWIRIESCH